jgi:hypothetical protein
MLLRKTISQGHTFGTLLICDTFDEQIIDGNMEAARQLGGANGA